MRRWARAATMASLLLASPTGVYAYKGTEHRQVSRDALCIALDYVGAPRCSTTSAGSVYALPEASLSVSCDQQTGRACCQPLPLTDLDEANLRALLDETASNISYADVVSFVDYVLDPIKLIQRDSGISGLPRWPKDLDEDFLFRLRTRPTLHLFAAQGNDSHFQAQMMMSWWLWHRQAVLAAAYGDATREGQSGGSERLFAGLLMNAISNHYLEDSFAPGHVYTPREGMHDSAAISMHDLYNRKGVCFDIDSDRWGELSVLIDPVRHAPLLGVQKEILETIKEQGFPEGKLRLLGDGYLIPSRRKREAVTGLEESAQRQRIFITLVVARTIIDVLESYACGRPVNKFEDYTWSPMQRRQVPEKKYEMARAGLPYGAYEEQLVDKVDYGLLSSLEISSQSTILGGVEDARGVVSAVVIPTFIAAPPPGMKVNDIYVPMHAVPTLALGLSYRMDDDLPGFGSFVRFSVLSPRLDLNMGVAFGVERYAWAQEESYRFHPEIRVGVGASLVMLFGAVGYDHALDGQGRLQGSLTVRAGAQIGIPWSKIPRRQRVSLPCNEK